MYIPLTLSAFITPTNGIRSFNASFLPEEELYLQTPPSVSLTYTCKYSFQLTSVAKQYSNTSSFLLELVMSFAAGIVQLLAYPDF
jgi:hypothetical protein